MHVKAIFATSPPNVRRHVPSSESFLKAGEANRIPKSKKRAFRFLSNQYPYPLEPMSVTNLSSMPFAFPSSARLRASLRKSRALAAC